VKRIVIAVVAVALSVTAAVSKEWVSGIVWPEPKVIDPGPVGGPPSDAIILFDGKDLSKWDGGDQWIIENGYAISHGGGITTKASFGDCQLHVEWATPEKIEGQGQGRGNSGVYLMGRYEVQILDSYQNQTYYDGQAGAIYKTRPPLVNASRKPGEWQSYDIVFHSPQFDNHGTLVKPGDVTVLHNGVLIQDHTELLGSTSWDSPPTYTAHPPRAPIHLQYHGNPVRFRNIWIRDITPLTPKYPE